MMNNLIEFFQKRVIHFKRMIPFSITFFLYLFGWGLLAPIFNIRINDITGSLFLSGIVFSILYFIKIFLDPSFGLLCDKFSPKKLLQWSLLSYSIIFFLYTLVSSFWQLVLIRVFHGLAASILWVSGWTLVRRKSKGRFAQEELSAWISVQNIAYILGPIIGGFVITAFSSITAFYLASLFSFFSFVYVGFRIKSPGLNHNHIKTFKQQLRCFFKNKSSAVRLVLLTLTATIISSAFTSFLPIQLDKNNISISEISVILSAALVMPYIVFPVTIGVLSDRYGRKIPTLIGLLLIFLGLYMFNSISSFAQFFFYTFMVNTGLAFVSLSIDAELNDLLPLNQAGGFTGIFEMIKDVGYSLGPFIFGIIASISINQAFLVFGVIALFSTIILKGFQEF